MFLKEDCPLRVGREALDDPQVKTCWKPSSHTDSHNRLNSTMHSTKKKPVEIPCTIWKCPSNFALDPNWHVAAGEESKEVHTQRHRLSRVLEVFDPNFSSIPPSAAELPDAKGSPLPVDDSCIPVIPLNPIEEEEAAYQEAPSQTPIELQAQDQLRGIECTHLDTSPRDLPISVKAPTIEKSGVDADAAAAAGAAYTAIMKCKEHGSLIDSDLLISILTNPDFIQQLAVSESPATTQGRVVSSTPDGMPEESADACVVSTNAGNVPVCASPQLSLVVPLPESNDTASRTFAVAPATTGSAPGPAADVVTPMLPLFIAKLDVGNEKPVEKLGACPSAGLVPLSEPLSATSCVSLCSEITEEMRISKTEIGESSSTGSVPLSGTKVVTGEVTDGEHPIPAVGVVTPYSWTPSVPYRMSKSTELLINSLMNESRGSTNTVATQNAGMKPVAPSAPLLSSKPDVMECKRLISQYGDSKKGEYVLESDPRAPYVMRTLKIETGDVPRPDMLQSSLHLTSLAPSIPQKARSVAASAPVALVKDMKYFKGLIEKHGEIQETMKVDIAIVGKLCDYVQGPSTSIEQKHPESGKPSCKFFNTPRGCKNGSNCRFRHIVEVSNPGEFSSEAPDSKRMKLSGEFGTK